MPERTTQKRIIRLFLTIVALFIILNSFTVFGMSDFQRRLFKTGIYYANVQDECAINTPGLPTPPSPGSSVYILGDSIVNQSENELKSEIEVRDFVVTKINADPGRAISSDTAGNEASGLDAIDEDSASIKDSDVAVIALGTNSGNEDLNVQIPALVNKLKTHNDNIRVFWVNLFYKSGSGPSQRNALIEENARKYNYSIIDTTKSSIELQSDNVHPSENGNMTYAKVLAEGLSKGGSSSATTNATTSSVLGLNYPAFNNESEVSANLTNFIKNNKPNSPWLNIGSDIGSWLMSESKSRNINPLMIAAIGKQENGFGTSDLVHVRSYYNYFGMKGSTPIDIPNNDYRGFSSPEEGIKFFMDKVKENTQERTNIHYKEVLNMYDYMSVHQTGKITYPGESLGPENGGMDGFDPTMRVYISWTTRDHPNNAYDGQIFNPGIYYTNSINFINTVTGLYLPTTPTKGVGLVEVCQGSSGSPGGSGLVDSTGYSFPLAPQNKSVGGITENQTETKHHDNTAAFDLFSVENAAVYAIFNGTIDKVNTSFNGISGCSSIQLYADDGYYYWYGHLKNTTVSDGARVVAGQKIAELADSSFTSDCIGSAPHLHIDRGCVIGGEPQRAGRDSCRDPDFIPFLSSLYSKLGER